VAKIEVLCFSCRKILTYSDNIGFREDCMHCRADVHVCKNCEFYDPRSYNECREPAADPVIDKERANYCEFFRPSTGNGNAQNQKDKLVSAAESLFKKK
jgi:hypothetical protein